MTGHNQPPAEPTIPAMSEANDLKPTKTSGFAVASFTLGIVAMFTFGFTSPLGLVFGIIAVIQMRMRKPVLTGRFYVISGIIINVIMMAVLVRIIANLNYIQNGHITVACSSNLKQIGTAMMMYSNENDECLPPADKWIDSISPYMRDNRILKCPSVVGAKTRTSYAMNNNLSGVKEDAIGDLPGTVLLFDSIPGDCPHGGTELLPSPERHIPYLGNEFTDTDEPQQDNKSEKHLKVNNFCFADGHTKSMTADQARSIIWNPARK